MGHDFLELRGLLMRMMLAGDRVSGCLSRKTNRKIINSQERHLPEPEHPNTRNAQPDTN